MNGSSTEQEAQQTLFDGLKFFKEKVEKKEQKIQAKKASEANEIT